MYFDTSQKLAVMSIGFLLQNKDDAVVWRGPKKNGRKALGQAILSFVERLLAFVLCREVVLFCHESYQISLHSALIPCL